MSDIAEEALREQIKPLIERSVLSGGSQDTDIQIAERAVRLALATDPNSKAMSHAVRILTAQRFYVERVESVRLEENTKRGIVRFTSPITPKSRKGWDELRTDPIWTEEGRQMFERMRGAIGHGGIVFKLVEDAGVFPDDTTKKDPDGNSLAGQIRKSRVIVYFIDQGEQDGAAGVGVDPTVPQGRTEADSGPAPSRVAHGEPYDPMPSESRGTTAISAPAGGAAPIPTPASPVPAKAGPSPEQIRAARLDDPLPAPSFRKPASVIPPPAPVLADDGIPLGAPGIPGLPEGKLRADVDPTDPPLPSELSVIAQHALRLTSGSDSVEHEANAHELVEALCCYSLVAPADGQRSYSQIRSRYHAAQLRAYLERQRTPQAVGS